MRNIVNVFIHPSIPFVVGAIGHFVTILTHNGSNDVFSQPLVPFGVSMTTILHFIETSNFGGKQQI